MSAKIICLAQSKGGTAKTTSVVNIAACLAQSGQRVLAIGLDAQCDLEESFGVDPVAVANNTIYELLTDLSIKAESLVINTAEGVDIIPASIDLGVIETGIKDRLGRERRLARQIEPLRDRYDYILMDTPPSFDLATLNGLTAADFLLIPIIPEPLCIHGLGGILQTFDSVRDNTNPNIKLLGAFITKYNSRRNAHKKIEQSVRESWGEQVFKTVIRDLSEMLDASLRQQSIVTFQKNSELAQAYLALTAEVVSRVENAA